MSLELNPYHSSNSKMRFNETAGRALYLPAKVVELGARRYLRSVLDYGDDYFIQERDTATIIKLRTMNGRDGRF
jgi:hypothetical protein